MHALVRLQYADGSWDLTRKLADAIGLDRSDLELRVATSTPLDDFRKVWATALALAWLERRAGHLNAEWGMVAEKGRRWLEHALRPLSSGRRWVDDAAKLL